jgi:RHS repeat-associated protein
MAAVWKRGLEGSSPLVETGGGGAPDGAQENGVFLRFPGQWLNATWAAASMGAEVVYNVHRWYENSTGRYTRTDPIVYDRAISAFGYAGQRPVSLVDQLGLQATGVPPGTATFGGGCCPSNSTCCSTAQAQGLFPPRAGGIPVCCNGRSVPCALFFSGKSGSVAAAQQLLIKCVLQHEQSHIVDLPDCPPACGVTPQIFDNPEERRRSECSATTTELNCLAGAESGCSGDPTCLNIIQLRKADIIDMKAEFGCWSSP